MTQSIDGKLKQLAELHHVQTSYFDAAGQEQFASREALVAILKVLGVPIENNSDIAESLSEARESEARLEPVQAAFD